ncbi:alpha/beta hydrolase [Devosia sp.]|uniref:alpha/beta fold hydrolase n=1 Tax=Devosia sp. TaxID=1871048 RepID=UPI001AD058D1|nr:alpha/beta hydrolase [Devosia sp.]MBN9308603.1 alpha/beta hydrolase [Devosia sp.]
MPSFTSKDGTTIAYDVRGSGPAVILIDGAWCGRNMGPMPRLAPLLAPHFTVYNYDRRSRGDSSISTDYSPDREYEDLAGLIDIAGGSAHLYGTSSGVAIALFAAARRLPVNRLAIFEPPFTDVPGGKPMPQGYQAEVERLVAEDNRPALARYFMVRMIGMPSFMMPLMRLNPHWKAMLHNAPSLPHDTAVMEGYGFPTEAARSIRVPTIVMSGDKTFKQLKEPVRLARETIPGARFASLPGQSHDAAAGLVAPILIDFFTGADAARIAA